MSYTNALGISQNSARCALLLLTMSVLGGCAGVPREPAAGGEVVGDGGTAATAEREIALFQQALASLNAAELDRAAAEFAELTRARPGLAGPWLNLALIAAQKNDFATAEKHVTQALAHNPRMPQAHNLLGLIEVNRGNMAAAARHYREALALNGDYALAHFNMALLHDIYLHDIPIAVQHYKRYLALTNNGDKKTADWLAELERSLSRGQP